MANVVPYSFAQELLKGTHNFTSNTIKLALYTANPYTTASTQYTTGSANQVSGTGYTTRGKLLAVAGQTHKLSNDTAIIDWTNLSWLTASITARGALIYNASSADKAVCVLDFGGDKTATAGTFTIQFPNFTDTLAILRIS